MQHFFVDETAKIELEGELLRSARLGAKEAHHIYHVLRLQPGEQVSLAYDKNIYIGTIDKLNKEEVLVSDCVKQDDNHELPLDITVIQGLPKGDKLEFIIQKSCELGAKALIPLICERSISKVKQDKADKQTARRREIALAACKQAKRGEVVHIGQVADFKTLFKDYKFDYLLLAYEDAAYVRNLALWWQEHKPEFVERIRNGEKLRLALLVGPEGGWSKHELDAFLQAGAEIVSLGGRILRTETAALTMLSYLMLEIESEVALNGRL